MQRSKRSGRIRVAALAAATAGVTGVGAVGRADTFFWDGNSGTNNNWNTDGNWTTAGFPGSGDEAHWTGDSTPSPTTVDVTGNQASRLFVNDKEVTFNLNNFTLAVGDAAQSDFQGTTGHAVFNGAGSLTMSGPMRIGFIGNNGHSQVTAQGGATVTTSGGISIGDYQNGGRVNVSGAGTTWNSTGPLLFARGGSPYVTFGQTHRAELLVTNGGVFTHTLGPGPGANSSNQFTMAPSGPAEQKNSRISVDGPGSQFNLLGSYNGNIRIGGYNGNVGFDVTNGGRWSAPNINMPLGFYSGDGVATVNVSGTNSRMSAVTFALSGRSTDDVGRNPTVVNVGAGGTFEATGFDGNDRSIAVGDRARLSLQGGTVSVPAAKSLNLRDAGLVQRSTLEGFGRITGGHLIAEADSLIRPGNVNAASGVGTIEVADGNVTTAGTGNGTLLEFELSTASGNPHDLIAAAATTSVVTIGDNATSAIDYAVFGGGTLAPGGEGFMDFLIGGTVNYGATVPGGDVPNIDNLDDLMAAAGYNRVSGTPGVGEYRYFLATVGAGDYGGLYAGNQALRLEMVVIPEPASLAILGLGTLPLLLRRRRPC